MLPSSGAVVPKAGCLHGEDPRDATLTLTQPEQTGVLGSSWLDEPLLGQLQEEMRLRGKNSTMGGCLEVRGSTPVWKLPSLDSVVLRVMFKFT